MLPLAMLLAPLSVSLVLSQMGDLGNGGRIMLPKLRHCFLSLTSLLTKQSHTHRHTDTDDTHTDTHSKDSAPAAT